MLHTQELAFPILDAYSIGRGVRGCENGIIEGDNLHVLTHLLATHRNRVDAICTDPPYNTHSKNFRFSDTWGSRRKGGTPNEAGDRRRARERHGAWLDFMAPRLSLMKELLKPGGVIAVSIDHHELFYLGWLMDTLFGEDNYLGLINWEKRYSPSNDAKHISDVTDYILAYGKGWPEGASNHRPRLPPLGQQGWQDDDPRLAPDLLARGDIPFLRLSPGWYDPPLSLECQSWGWRYSGHNQDATRLVNAIMGNSNTGATPKPLKLIKKVLQLWCPSDGLVLDAFAGSGTVGHAVLALNQEAGVSRRFLLIEQGNPQRGDLFARTLTAERLHRVITGEWASGPQPPLPGAFTFYTCY